MAGPTPRVVGEIFTKINLPFTTKIATLLTLCITGKRDCAPHFITATMYISYVTKYGFIRSFLVPVQNVLIFDITYDVKLDTYIMSNSNVKLAGWIVKVMWHKN